MGSPKKSAAEKAKTRKGQNERYRAAKARQGLKLVAVWIPAEILERCEGMKKIGVVFGENGDPVSGIWKAGRFVPLDVQGNLFR